MFQSLRSDLSSIKSVKKNFYEKECTYFNFPTLLFHLLSSITVTSHPPPTLWLQRFVKFYNCNLTLPFQDDLFPSPDKIWTLIPAPLCVTVVTFDESFNLSNPWFPIWKMEIIILLSPHCHSNMVIRKGGSWFGQCVHCYHPACRNHG